MSRVQQLFADPLKVNAYLILAAFGSMFILPSQSTTAIFTYLLGVLMLFQVRRWRSYLNEPLVIVSGVLLGYLCLSSFWSEPVVLDKARSMAVRALSTFLFLIAFAECWQAGYLQRGFSKVLVVAGGGAAAVAIANFLITSPEDGRLNGLGQLGAHVIAGLMFGVVLIHLLQSTRDDGSARWRAIAAGLGVVLLIAIVLTFSRNAWMSSMAGLAIFACAVFTPYRKAFLMVVTSTAGVFAVLLLLLLSTEAGSDWLLPRGDSFRPLIWSTILERVWEQGPVFGLGILTPDDVPNGATLHPHPHNMYLAVLYQGGLVGLGLFFGLIGLVLRTFWSHLELAEVRVALASITVGLLSYLLDGHELVDRIGETWMLFWLPVAVSLSARFRPQTPEPSAYPQQPDPS